MCVLSPCVNACCQCVLYIQACIDAEDKLPCSSYQPVYIVDLEGQSL